eukprot:3117440-Rhodomonas_salina.1
MAVQNVRAMGLIPRSGTERGVLPCTRSAEPATGRATGGRGGDFKAENPQQVRTRPVSCVVVVL